MLAHTEHRQRYWGLSFKESGRATARAGLTCQRISSARYEHRPGLQMPGCR